MKIALFITTALILLTMATTTRTHASVVVENNITSVNNTDGTSTSHVTIQTNGEVKEFNTTGDESVDWTSEDGKSTVKINNNKTTVTNQSNSSTNSGQDSAGASGTVTPSPMPEPTSAEANQEKNEVNAHIPTNPFSMIVVLIKSLISLL